MWYVGPLPAGPVVTAVSFYAGIFEEVAAARVFSTVDPDAGAPGSAGFLLIGVSCWRALIDESVLSTRSSINVLLPNGVPRPRPKPPALLVSCGVLGVGR